MFPFVKSVSAVRLLCGLGIGCVTSVAPVAGQNAVAPSMRVLGAPFGYESAVPSAINSGGEIVGDASAAPGPQVPFFWSEETGFVLFTNGMSGSAFDVNDRSEVVGWTETTGGFIWSEKQGLRDLGEFVPRAINDRGDIVGTCTGSGVWLQCLRTAGSEFVYVSTDSSLNLVAIDVGNRGEVVGGFSSNGGQGAFYWSRRTGLVLVPPTPNTTLIFYNIRPNGEITGLIGEAGTVKLSLWQRSSRGVELEKIFPNIPTPWINRQGLAVGSVQHPLSTSDDQLATVWRLSDGAALDLHDPTLTVTSGANAVNDKNQITGTIAIQGSHGGFIPILVIWEVPHRWVKH